MLLFYSILYLAKSLLQYKCKVTRHPQQSQRGEEKCNAVALSYHVFISNNMFWFVFNLNLLISWSMFFAHLLTLLYCSVITSFSERSSEIFPFFCLISLSFASTAVLRDSIISFSLSKEKSFFHRKEPLAAEQKYSPQEKYETMFFSFTGRQSLL